MSSQAKAEAGAHAEQLAKQLQAEQAKVQQQVFSEISDVKQTATAANAKIADVSTDVGTVRSQATATQSQLDKTIADLKSTKGDLGVQSGLIATNASELQALQAAGRAQLLRVQAGQGSRKEAPARAATSRSRSRRWIPSTTSTPST